LNTQKNTDTSQLKQEVEIRLARLLEYLKHDSDNLKLIGEIADLQLQIGLFEYARTLLQGALAKHPGNAGLQFRLATIAMASGDVNDAIARFRSLQDSGIKSDVLNYNFAYSLMLDHQFDAAKELLLPLVNEAKESVPHATALLARCYHHLGMLDESISIAESFLQSHPDNTEILGIMALLNLDAEHLDSAKAYAQKAADLDVSNLDARITLGTLALAEQEDEEAERYFSQAITSNPENGRAWAGLGLAHMLKLSPEKAVSDLEKAVRFMPTHIGTWHALAWAQIVTKDLSGAKESFEHAMALDRNFSETHGGLAVIAALSNEPEAEVNTLIQRAIRLDPNSFSGRYAKSLLAGRYDNKSSQVMVQEIMNSLPSESAQQSLGESLQQYFRKRAPKH
jgi:tetratricopeptide (TPR) repeat protein